MTQEEMLLEAAQTGLTTRTDFKMWAGLDHSDCEIA